MKNPKQRRPLLALVALAGASCLAACGDAPPAPVSVPADFSAEPDVTALLQAKAKAAAAAPERAESHRTLGLALAANDGATLAEESFARALALDPKDVESRYQLGQLKGARGDLDGQIADLQAALEIDPTFYAATYSLGCALLDRGDLDGAIDAFRTVQRKQGPTFMGELGLGLVELERDRPGEAIPLLTKAAKKYPNDLFIRFQLGQAHLALGQDDVAARLMTGIEDGQGRPILRSPGTAQIDEFSVNRLTQIKRATDSMRAGRFNEALPILRKFYRQDESDTAAGNNLAVTYMRVGELDEAAKVIERCLAQDPDNYGVWVTKANVLLNTAERTRAGGDVPASLKELEQSFAAIERATELAPRVGRVHLVRGQILNALRRDDESIATFAKAIELGETQESTYIDMGGPLRRTGGVTAVEAILREGMEQPGPRARLRFELCGVLVNSGRGKEARAVQRSLAQVAPGSTFTKRADELLRSKGY